MSPGPAGPWWRAPLVLALLAPLVPLLFPGDLAFAARVAAVMLFVLSLDLVTGFLGVATLGHAALFGAGAYAAGIACARGVVTEPVTLLMLGALAGAAAGLVTGGLLARAHGLAQLVLSIALVQLAGALANAFPGVTGGSDGLGGVAPGPVLGLIAFDFRGHVAYALAATLLVLVLALLSRVARSPFGLLCRAIRQDAERVAAMGARAAPAIAAMYALSGAVAGAAGALGAVTAGVVGLDSLSFERSAEALVMLVLGGPGSLTGALIGALVFQVFEHVVSAASPFHWLALVGAMLIGVVLFLPEGLQGLGARALRLARRRRAA